MNASDLRIGNYVEYITEAPPVPFTGTSLDSSLGVQNVGMMMDFGPVRVKDLGEKEINGLSEELFLPIPLTPELLQNCCGFTQRTNGDYVNETDKSLHLRFEDDESLELYKAGDGLISKIPYLHELQNRFADNSDQELSVNLSPLR